MRDDASLNKIFFEYFVEAVDHLQPYLEITFEIFEGLRKLLDQRLPLFKRSFLQFLQYAVNEIISILGCFQSIFELFLTMVGFEQFRSSFLEETFQLIFSELSFV